MKRLLLILALAFIVASCNSKKECAAYSYDSVSPTEAPEMYYATSE